jgi:hypothetical protein
MAGNVGSITDCHSFTKDDTFNVQFVGLISQFDSVLTTLKNKRIFLLLSNVTYRIMFFRHKQNT